MCPNRIKPFAADFDLQYLDRCSLPSMYRVMADVDLDDAQTQSRIALPPSNEGTTRMRVSDWY